MAQKIKAAIIGPGNIGTDLLFKLRRSPFLEVAYVVGVKESPGIEIAKGFGIPTTIKGIDEMLEVEDIRIVFDATGAGPHLVHAPRLKAAGKIAIDLTPAAVGPYVVPSVNLSEEIFRLDNVNMVTCAGQATSPIVYAINRAADVYYAEVVSSISSKSAGPGTRQNLNEFIETTTKALKVIGGADQAKAIIVLNPAEPPILMRNTILCRVRKPDLTAIRESIDRILAEVKTYVPGYRFLVEPILEGDTITTVIEVEGLGDFLPKHTGNLDIINAAAVNVAERFAARIQKGKR
ncbi:MAG: acetaldehyde dehydrogenase (acetylating) [Spirochaetae bacterium HGW-Spirochaetae-9]|nr:MAG: acetaldehyde dehydrogenase (acetylating) [Spirochaetae bacterium HGW-Spirochaetae-9]